MMDGMANMKKRKKMPIEKVMCDQYQVYTPDGWSNFTGMRRLKKPLYRVKTTNHQTDVTKDHPFTIISKGKRYTSRLSDLSIGDRLQTITGYEEIVSIKPLKKKADWVYDLLDVQKHQNYYSDDILSHNSFLETGQAAVDNEILNHFRAICKAPLISLENGTYKIWEEPIENHIYVFGIDVGEGVGQAASVVQILDITDLTNIKQVATYHNNKIDPFHFASMVHKMAYQWGKPYLLIERNNCGGQVIDALKEVHHYHNIVDHGPENNFERLGIYSHTHSKYESVMNMRYWVNSLRVVSIHDLATVQEIETFIKHPNGTWRKRAGDYIYDDRVMALVWGLFILDPRLTERYYNVISLDTHGKPSKIESMSVEKPEFFKLDPFFQRDAEAPLPAFIGVNMDNQEGMDNLMKQGWKPLE